MDLATIEMERPKAQEAFKAYRDAVKKRHSTEDEQIMRGYKALAKGQQLIALTDTIKAGGLNKLGLPRLACIRADAQWCHVRVYTSGAVHFGANQDPSWTRSRWNRVVLPDGTFANATYRHDYRAMVPIVPPPLRPQFKLSNYHVLWEADWQKNPPRDPALLRHIGGDLYAVLAVWDLTDLERAVLSGRRR